MEQIDRIPSCPDPNCDAVAALLAIAALGSDLRTDEQTQMLGYLATCARCRLRLDGFTNVAQALPLIVPEAEPSPALRERVLVAAAAGQPRPHPLRRTRRDWRTTLTSAFAVAAVLLGLLAGQQYLGSQQQQQQTARNRAVVIAAFGNDDSLEARFVPSQQAPQASGRVLISQSEPAVVVYAKQLPQLAPGRVYQVRLQGGGAVVGVGSFVPDANNRAWALLGPQAVLPTPEAIFITEEPASGSPQPSGEALLYASFP